MSRSVEIGGGYSYANLRVGMTVRNPAGEEVYIQPGDDEAAMMADIAEEAHDNLPAPSFAYIVGVTLGEYFA